MGKLVAMFIRISILHLTLVPLCMRRNCVVFPVVVLVLVCDLQSRDEGFRPSVCVVRCLTMQSQQREYTVEADKAFEDEGIK